MPEKKKQILENFEKMLPAMSDMEVEKLLSFGEGMAFIKDIQKEETAEAT